MNIVMFCFICVVFLFLLTLESIRRGILETNEAFIWIVACVIIMVFFSSNDLYINGLAKWLHVYHAPSLLFIMGFLFLIIMVFDLTRRLSKINAKLVALTQEYVLLREKYKREQINK